MSKVKKAYKKNKILYILIILLVLFGFSVFFLLKPLIFSSRVDLPTGISIRVPNNWYKEIDKNSEEKLKETGKVGILYLSDKKAEEKRYKSAYYWQDNQTEENKDNTRIIITIGATNFKIIGNRSAINEYQDYLRLGNPGKITNIDNKLVFYNNIKKNTWANEFDYNFDYKGFPYQVRISLDHKNSSGKKISKIELLYYKFIANKIINSIKFEQ